MVGRTVCPECSRTLHIHSLHRHMTRIHKYDKEEHQRLKEERIIAANSSRIACPLCAGTYINYEMLANHCSEKHSEDGANGRPQNYAIFENTFVNKQDYERWLEEECQRRCTSFSITRTVRKADCTKQYLGCTRAGRYIEKGRKRMKISRKDTRYCPCFLNVVFRKNGRVAVKGCFGHAGHSLDPAMLRLSAGQREFLKELLKEHTINYVIQRLRSEYHGKDSKLLFVTKKDLWQIIRKYNLRPNQLEESDSTLLSLCVDENNQHDDVRSNSPDDSSENVNDTLISGLGDKSTSTETKAAGRSMVPSYYVVENNRRHRKAFGDYGRRSHKILFVGNYIWKVESVKGGEVYTVKWNNMCTCNLPSNAHCLLCDACPFSWDCSCFYQRSGLCCIHTHAVKLFGEYRDLTNTSRVLQGLEERSPLVDSMVSGQDYDEKEETMEAEGEDGSPSRERKERILRILHSIESTWSVVEMGVYELAKQDDNEAVKALEKILVHMDTAAAIITRICGSLPTGNK